MVQQRLARLVASNASRPRLRLPIQLLLSTVGYIEFCVLHHWFTFLQLIFSLMIMTIAWWFAETEVTAKNAFKQLFIWCVFPFLLTTTAIALTLILFLALLPNDAFSH